MNNPKNEILRIALASGFYDIVEQISKADGYDIKNDIERSKIHIAAEKSQIDIINDLLKNGNDPNTPDNKSNTPIMYACHFKQMAAISFLLSNGADIIKNNDFGKNSIFIATSTGDINVVRSLIQNKHIDPIHFADSFAEATSKGYTDIVTMFIDIGIDVNIKDRFGRIPLMWAVWFDKVEIIELLINNGADTTNLKENDRKKYSHIIENYKMRIERKECIKGSKRK